MFSERFQDENSMAHMNNQVSKSNSGLTAHGIGGKSKNGLFSRGGAGKKSKSKSRRALGDITNANGRNQQKNGKGGKGGMKKLKRKALGTITNQVLRVQEIKSKSNQGGAKLLNKTSLRKNKKQSVFDEYDEIEQVFGSSKLSAFDGGIDMDMVSKAVGTSLAGDFAAYSPEKEAIPLELDGFETLDLDLDQEYDGDGDGDDEAKENNDIHNDDGGIDDVDLDELDLDLDFDI